MDLPLRAFAEHLEVQHLSENTLEAYCQDVAAFFTWLVEKVADETSLEGVIASDVRAYRDHLVYTEHKAATINRRLAGLRAFFDWAVETGKVTSNPARNVKGVQQTRQVPRSLGAQEVYKLQRAAATQRQLAEAQKGKDSGTAAVVLAHRDEALLNLILYTGLRVGEVASLTLEDVVLNERSGTVVVRAEEGRKCREIPLHKEARKTLLAYLEIRPKDENDRFFLGQRGALGKRGIQMRLRRLGEAVGVEVTPRVLRHTLATRLLGEADSDLTTVAELLGHTDLASTAIYTQPNGGILSKAVEGLE